VPFALIGGVFALLLSGEYLSVPASVGFIALLGVAAATGDWQALIGAAFSTPRNAR